jgi:hypothetical protein
MAEIAWHRRETRRPTEKTNICLNGGKAPAYSPVSQQTICKVSLGGKKEPLSLARAYTAVAYAAVVGAAVMAERRTHVLREAEPGPAVGDAPRVRTRSRILPGGTVRQRSFVIVVPVVLDPLPDVP